MSVRPAAVAGFFYPGDPGQLETGVRAMLDKAVGAPNDPAAMILPHAGYAYSGPVAATGYASVQREIERVVLLGPAHRYAFRGVATHSRAVSQGSLRAARTGVDETERR